ncbi:MAG: triose-phosphate isomerase [Microgenomates group bacterium]
MIFLNFKTYESGTGDTALAMSKIVEEVSLLTDIKIIPVVQTSDIREIVSNIAIEVWTQKIDPVTYGAHTGSILPESVLEDGARGTFLNHSENRFVDFETLKKAHDRAREVGLKTLVFAKDIKELEKVCSLKPDYISYEPPALIGSKDKSVASAEPEIIAKAVEISKKSGIPLIVGAGVHSEEDVRTCIELGAMGIAVASDVMMANNPRAELLDLVEGFK